MPGALSSLGCDAGHVRRWVQLLDWREELEAAIQETPAVDGSTQNKVVSPFNRLRESCVKELQVLEENLGLTPGARKRLGIVVAEEDGGGGAGFGTINAFLKQGRGGRRR